MTDNEMLAEIQVLRQLIANRHQWEEHTAFTRMATDKAAIDKLRMQLEWVFERDRESRILALSLLVGRSLQSSVGNTGLTVGEVYALLDWIKWGKAFPDVEPKAEETLDRLSGNPQKWRPLIRRRLGAVETPHLTRVEYDESDTLPF